MKRFLVLSVVFVSLLQAAASARQPNVVLVITDDQGCGDMSCHGNPYLKTPNIDRRYRDSIRLTDFHVDLLPTFIDLCRIPTPSGWRPTFASP